MGTPEQNSNYRRIAFIILIIPFLFLLFLSWRCTCSYRGNIDERVFPARWKNKVSHEMEDELSSTRTVNKFTCQTPNAWLPHASQGSGSGHGRKWPNGIVPYKLHCSLTFDDRLQVQKAFEEYHSKTCIKFKPWDENDQSFISIEVDNRVCGKANVCKNGGYQFVKFGRNCRNTATMIHQLGHALCLGHEHQRSDRDNFLNVKRCYIRKDGPMAKLYAEEPKRLYDYASQMHFKCGSCPFGNPTKPNVTKCGRQITQGLSVLDADHINALYDCQGCFRHRWLPIEYLTDQDFKDMYNFGYNSRTGSPLYPCRAQIHGEIAIGKYQKVDKTCYIPSLGKETKLQTNVEVLLIPGGLNQFGKIYQLVKKYEMGISPFLVPGGRQADQVGLGLFYIAFGRLKNMYGEMEGTIGKYSLENDKVFFPLGGGEQGSEDFSLLTCRKE
ncbi:unnamed protein product [Orchesella dallaii]|uniref:Metalloendopeptidase n=1 Tax=Orchesella dallaii TaxID=48710 RepID=A0ABP1RV26_9HEXA